MNHPLPPEIAAIEEALLTGGPDSAGLFMASVDWNMELRLIEEEIGMHRP